MTRFTITFIALIAIVTLTGTARAAQISSEEMLGPNLFESINTDIDNGINPFSGGTLSTFNGQNVISVTADAGNNDTAVLSIQSGPIIDLIDGILKGTETRSLDPTPFIFEARGSLVQGDADGGPRAGSSIEIFTEDVGNKTLGEKSSAGVSGFAGGNSLVLLDNAVESSRRQEFVAGSGPDGMKGRGIEMVVQVQTNNEQSTREVVFRDFGFYEVQAIPEPATMTLLGLGGLAMLRRRRG